MCIIKHSILIRAGIGCGPMFHPFPPNGPFVKGVHAMILWHDLTQRDTMRCDAWQYYMTCHEHTTQCSKIRQSHDSAWHSMAWPDPTCCGMTYGQKCTSKGIWRQGRVLKHRNSLHKSLCPVVTCPYLCSSDMVSCSTKLLHLSAKTPVGGLFPAAQIPRSMWLLVACLLLWLWIISL